MRLFFGTLLSPVNQAFYSRWGKDLAARQSSAVRAIPDGSAHITYVFAADVDESAVDPLIAAVAAAVARYPPIAVRVGKPHVIGGARPRLVCAHLMTGGQTVADLGRVITDAAKAACPKASWNVSRSPHVTLARFRKTARGTESRAVAESLDEKPTESRDDRIVQVELIVSQLGKTGPSYVVHSAHPLHGVIGAVLRHI